MRLIALLVIIALISPIVMAAASQEDAEAAIGSVRLEIEAMEADGFPSNSTRDMLEAAELELERAKAAEEIRSNASAEEKEDARLILSGLDPDRFTYDSVINMTDLISERIERAYFLRDAIRAAEIEVQAYRKESVDTSEAEAILAEAKAAFVNERYSETEALLESVGPVLEESARNSSLLGVAARASRSFIANNWLEMLILLSLSVIGGWLIWRKVHVNRLEERIKKMKAEKKSVVKLIKKAQEDRYKNETLSESVYRIRLESYFKRLNEIKSSLPALEKELKMHRKRKR